MKERGEKPAGLTYAQAGVDIDAGSAHGRIDQAVGARHEGGAAPTRRLAGSAGSSI